MRSVWGIAAIGLSGCVSHATNALLDATWRTSSIPPAAERPAETQRDQADMSGALSREAIVAAAVGRDPGLAARTHRVRAAMHAARAEGSLPPPEASFQVWNVPLLRPYALNDAQMYMVEVRQMFPAIGLLDARARARAEDARASVADLAVRQTEVVRRVNDAYADYLGATLDHRVHGDHLRLLDEMLDLARARLSPDGTSLADIARIEVERARVRRDLTRINGQVARARVTLNTMLLRRPDAPLGAPGDIDPQVVRLPLEELIQRALRARGLYAQATARARAARARTQAAQAEASWPSFSIAASYWQEPRMEPGIGTSIGMSLPWLWGGLRARVAEARENEAAETASVLEVEVQVQGDVAAAHARLAALEQQLISLYREGQPAAARSIEAVRAAYVANRTDLLAWIDSARSILDLRVEAAELTASLSRVISELEFAVGATLPRSNISPQQDQTP